MRSASSELVKIEVRSPLLTNRNGSTIASGTSWRIAAERSVSP